jgi:hypothetical protein
MFETFGHPEILIVGLALDWADPLRSYQAALVWARLFTHLCGRKSSSDFTRNCGCSSWMK